VLSVHQNKYHILFTTYTDSIKKKKNAIDVLENINKDCNKIILETIKIVNESIKQDKNEILKMNTNWKEYKESLTM
jgi:hypothetical protein